jgi:hypothetical protein
MRIVSILALGTLAGALALAAGRTESVTYVDGNLTGVAPYSPAILVYSGNKELQLHAGKAAIQVPFESIAKTEMSAPQVHSNDVPLYKVWALPKRFGKTETNLLTVNFKDNQGADRTMTLELGAAPAASVLAAIKTHNPNVETRTLAQAEAPALKQRERDSEAQAKAPQEQTKPSAEGWWGDKYWKTSRNADRWGKGSPSGQE